MHRRMPRIALAALLAAALCPPARAQQMFPSRPDGNAISAYIIPPDSGLGELPAKWSRNSEAAHTNCQLAGYHLQPDADAEPLTVTSYKLPVANYTVYICYLGEGRACLAGSRKWVNFRNPGGYYAWAKLGQVRAADSVTVKVDASRGRLRYAGLLAEGDKLPVIPVVNVRNRLYEGKPVTILLIGDSVTENAKGFRGGSSKFETGNPGLLKEYLEKEFGNAVSYISHREPPGWPDNGDANLVKAIEVGGRTLRDGRVEYDPNAKIRLVNLGQGGAASNDAWRRLGETFVEAGEWRLIKGHWLDHRDGGQPPILRNGAAHYKPDLVIINFGTNDTNGSHQRWRVSDYLFHMKVLATMCQQRFGAAVILATPHRWTRGVHLHPHKQPAMADAIRAYAAEANLALADIYNEYDHGEYDGIHPGDTGHKRMADAYLKALMGEKSIPRIMARASAKQFTDNGDGTVTDETSRLTWFKDAGGKDVSPEQAAAYLTEINKGKKHGHADWRLPTREEMLAITDPARRSPALPAGHPFENVKGWYLTSTTEMKRNWGVDMDRAFPYFIADIAKAVGRVWPVRGGR
ncbi:MAG TPA: DUF1566 domain-containing protein [Phycisphaerae bacterium]|nr:DUF1566 domain-containing protein [Phycisphaerae bacterium]